MSEPLRTTPHHVVAHPATPPVDRKTWELVQRFMERNCGVVVRDDQIYLLASRLAPVVRRLNYHTIADLVVAACASPSGSAAALAVIDAMTTHETYFFRDPPFWKYVEETVLPRLVSRLTGGRALRIWSAACSTGQEPYSLAMLIDERFPEFTPRLEIVATDVSDLTLKRARERIFSPLEVNRGLGAARLVKHFSQVPGGFRISDRLRTRITWRSHNLLAPNPDPMERDLVLCRNVLIYFGDTDRAAVVRRLIRSVAPAGYLGVGTSEALRGRAVAPGLYEKEALAA